MNPLYNAMNNNGNSSNNGISGIMGIVSNFMSFANNFRGNPNDKINELLSNGSVSKEQYENAVKIAKQVEPFVRKMLYGNHNT